MSIPEFNGADRMQRLTPARPSFAELPPEWVGGVRERIRLEGLQCRVVQRRLEVLIGNVWVIKQLPNGGTDLATEADAVQLWTAVKI